MGGPKGATYGKKGAKGGSKGKGKDIYAGWGQWAEPAWGQQSSWDSPGAWAAGADSWANAGEEWTEASGASGYRPTRIKNRFQVAASLLRGACGEDGTAFSRSPQFKKKNDFQMLEPAAVRSHMDWGSAHLCRRPGIGMSEAAGSLQVLGDLLTDGFPKLDLDDLTEFLADEELTSALAEINVQNDRSVGRSTGELAESVHTMLRKLVKGGSQAREAAARACVFGSRLYVGSLQFLQMHALATAPAEWKEWVHPDLANAKAVKKWIERPKDREAMSLALATLMTEARKKSAEYEEGSKNKASDLFGKKRKAAPDDNDEGEDDDGDDDDNAPRIKGRGKGQVKGKRSSSERAVKSEEEADSDESQEKGGKAKKNLKKKAKKDKKKSKKSNKKSKQTTSSSAGDSGTGDSSDDSAPKGSMANASKRREEKRAASLKAALDAWEQTAAEKAAHAVAAMAQLHEKNGREKKAALPELKVLLEGVPEAVTSHYDAAKLFEKISKYNNVPAQEHWTKNTQAAQSIFDSVVSDYTALAMQAARATWTLADAEEALAILSDLRESEGVEALKEAAGKVPVDWAKAVGKGGKHAEAVGLEGDPDTQGFDDFVKEMKSVAIAAIKEYKAIQVD